MALHYELVDFFPFFCGTVVMLALSDIVLIKGAICNTQL